MKYAVVDRVDGLSRDPYASKDAIEAVTHDPGLRDLPVGALFALDVYRARVVGRELPGDGLPCHQAARVSDMAFTTSGAVQYRYCPQPGRQICPF